ncbi:MAG: hypothetical protein BGO29_10550 [Bacteroidales bacterium 36-12]|nr:MAG: hypothetical protein BGO29_10550 [Bacteroidales bacterium 36-12]
MANIRQNEFLILEKQFEMERGFVLDFYNSSFQQFIYNVCGLDIYNSKYAIRGDSKAKRLRIFWQTESDSIVGKLINEMLAYWKTSRKVNSIEITKEEAIIFNDCLTIANRLRGVYDKTTSKNAATTKDEFLKREYKNINVDNLDIDAHVIEIIKSRLFEIQRNIHSESALSAVILCGSVLEGLLLGIAIKNIKDFNQSSASPKNRETGKVLLLQDWTLSSLIDVAQNIGFIGLDVKKFSHSLRDFRNYIHPYQQMSTGFIPDIDTAKISWQVLQAAISDLNGKKP